VLLSGADQFRYQRGQDIDLKHEREKKQEIYQRMCEVSSVKLSVIEEII
jgi:hypothetical protein